jgi:hypothetical protein
VLTPVKAKQEDYSNKYADNLQITVSKILKYQLSLRRICYGIPSGVNAFLRVRTAGQKILQRMKTLPPSATLKM